MFPPSGLAAMFFPFRAAAHHQVVPGPRQTFPVEGFDLRVELLLTGAFGFGLGVPLLSIVSPTPWPDET
jgi:hypothetical protein